MNISNRLLIYKTLHRPIWAYGIAHWGTDKPSNTRAIIQAFQAICLRTVNSAPWVNVTNIISLHQYLKPLRLIKLLFAHYSQFHSNALLVPLNSTNLPGNPVVGSAQMQTAKKTCSTHDLFCPAFCVLPIQPDL